MVRTLLTNVFEYRKMSVQSLHLQLGNNTPDHMKFAACMAVSFSTFFYILLVLFHIIVYIYIYIYIYIYRV